MWDVDGDEIWAAGVRKDEDGTVRVHIDVIGASSWDFVPNSFETFLVLKGV